ncbi:glycosyltransferase family 4 protein [Patescibacteria group bacterium]|nr:glycosyltransferase family 4 protein [Patescibacteria group bacterium]
MKLLILTQKVDKNDDILGFFHGWIAEFAKHCEKITVIALGVGEHDLPRNVKVLSLGKDKNTSSLRAIAKQSSKQEYIANFYKYIWQERNNYDNVFVHMNPEYVVLGGFLWRLWGKKIGLWYMHKSVDLKLRLAEKLTHIIFSATSESFRLETKKLNITGHGIDVNRFNKKEDNLKKDIFSIITIGRISPIKDYDTLINSIKFLREKGLKIKLDIIGGVGKPDQKKYLENLKQKVKDYGLENNISFIGSVPNKEIVDYLHRADLFVNTSQTGSLDKAILEAMSCGLLVLSSNDSSKNVFAEYSEKLFFKPKSVNDLSNKIENIIRLSEEDKIKIGKRLRNIVVNDHNLENLIKKIIRLYQKI